MVVVPATTSRRKRHALACQHHDNDQVCGKKAVTICSSCQFYCSTHRHQGACCTLLESLVTV